MLITPLEIEGAFLIKRTPSIDERGYFVRTYCEKEFQDNGINIHICQINLCENKEKYTLRGMHLQIGEYAEDKVVSCNRGVIYDVFVDMRPESSTYLQHFGYELSEENGCMLFIPKGCAHGYITLEENCQLLYLMSEFYEATAAKGYMFDEPLFGIKWPKHEGLVMSDKDKHWEYL